MSLTMHCERVMGRGSIWSEIKSSGSLNVRLAKDIIKIGIEMKEGIVRRGTRTMRQKLLGWASVCWIPERMKGRMQKIL